MATYTYLQGVAPKTRRDQILLTIWKANLNGIPCASLKHFVTLYGQVIHMAATGGLIKHQGEGKYTLTKNGQSLLESRYAKLPSNAGFTIGEIE